MGVRQTTHSVLMIRPSAFGSNPEAEDNIFCDAQANLQAAAQMAQAEFELAVACLQAVGVKVVVFDDLGLSPDAIFPNNWFSNHASGQIVLYPLRSPLRRSEVRMEIVKYLQDSYGFQIVLDWRSAEAQGLYLEGTGSLVLDRVHQIAYASLSERTHWPLLEAFSQALGYQIQAFHTVDPWQGLPIYHTNVLLSVGPQFAVLCSELIIDIKERQAVLAQLARTDKTCLEITPQQMQAFAGNILALHNTQGEPLIALSERAYHSLKAEQREFLASQGQLVIIPLTTIETLGGGSMRCMLAEIFEPD